MSSLSSKYKKDKLRREQSEKTKDKIREKHV